MYWDFRIMRHKEKGHTWYELHEVFYNSKGKVEGWTENGVAHSESVKELHATLLMMLLDSKKKRKILDYREE